MFSFFFISTSLLLICLSYINATPTTRVDSHSRNLIQFGNMISQVVGTSALNYNGYGCWCGLGGKGEPVDATDACCKAHDECYDEIIANRPSFLTCSPYVGTYAWDFDPLSVLSVCKNPVGSCAFRICECDRIVTECYKRNVHTFDKSLKCPK